MTDYRRRNLDARKHFDSLCDDLLEPLVSFLREAECGLSQHFIEPDVDYYGGAGGAHDRGDLRRTQIEALRRSRDTSNRGGTVVNLRFMDLGNIGAESLTGEVQLRCHMKTMPCSKIRISSGTDL